MNELDCLNDTLNLTNSASNFYLKFLLFADFANFAAERFRAVKRSPSAEDLTVRQAGVIIADMPSVKFLQSLLKDG